MRRTFGWAAGRSFALAIALAVVTAGSPRADTGTPATAPPPLPGAKRPPEIVSPERPASPKAPEKGDKPGSEPKPSGDASAAQAVTLVARPVAMLTGKSDWEQGFETINASLKTIQDALAKAKIKSIGHPQAVFRETDDNGFEYQAIIPVDPSTDTKTKLDSNVVFGLSPTGKAIKFPHRGAYEQIDSTYEAITAYLDEKGYDTNKLFIEEYLNSVKSPDDANLQADIYVLVK